MRVRKRGGNVLENKMKKTLNFVETILLNCKLKSVTQLSLLNSIYNFDFKENVLKAS